MTRELYEVAAVAACQQLGINRRVLESRRRHPHDVFARAIVALVLTDQLGIHQTEIGRLMGGRDHATVQNLLAKRPEVMGRPDLARAFEIVASATAHAAYAVRKAMAPLER
jgi:hypothetical protein